MKNMLFLFAMILSVIALNSCTDTSGLENQIDNIEGRVAALEKLTSQMNTNISALQSAVAALQNNDYVTNVSEVKEGDTIVGYTLTFAKSGAVTIYHGIDGLTPVVGVKQFTDGLYYWTIDGDWMTDDSGDMIRAQGVDGQDGADGITPQLKIENEHWMLSMDKGDTWSDLGKAKGDDGDSFFQSVTQDDNNVYLNFIDGTTITLPKEKQLSITFEESADISITAGATKTLNYSIIGATAKTIVKAMGQNGWSAKVTPADNESGTITVTAPDPLVEDEILVWVYDGETKTIMSSLNFVTGVIEIASNAYSLPKEASSQTVTVNTNVDYIVEIPEDAQSWLSVASTRSAMRTETLTFNFTENVGFSRYTTVSIKNKVGKVLQSISVKQEGSTIEVNVNTPGTLSTLLTNNQKLNSKALKISGTLNNLDFLFITEMTSLQFLDMSELANNELPIGLFKENKNIREVILPNTLEFIPESLFRESSIEKCAIPDGVTIIKQYAFYNSSLSGKLVLPKSLKHIESYAFYICSITSLKMNEGLESIGEGTFHLCLNLRGELKFPSTLLIIDSGSFTNCKNIEGNIIIPENVYEIGLSAFDGCSKINKIYCKNQNPPVISGLAMNIFPNYTYLGVPVGSKTKYLNAQEVYDGYDKWSNFLIIEEVDFDALGI